MFFRFRLNKSLHWLLRAFSNHFTLHI
uniref:Uncharacterized protein n=1 Tax=Anguilla anguilla TaxID=7936 RepID=A0A0E9SWJ0_ANGAN